MSGVTMHDRRVDADGGAKPAATTAIFLWVLVVCALAYGLINTFRTVVDLFGG